MTNFRFRDVNDALPDLARSIITFGATVPSRVGETKELTYQSVGIASPLNREILVPSRRASLPAQIVESAWVLAGKNDVATLLPYLPRAAEFSDNGVDWRAGYGKRLRSFYEQDQLDFVVELLKSDPTTRRAVMSIWDPSTDKYTAKDIPCNNWLHFMARDGVLSLHVAIRSNDLIWGWSGINQFEWSVLLEVVAQLAGLGVGKIVYAISSLHVYDHHYDRATKIAGDEAAMYDPNKPTFEAHSLGHMDDLLAEWFQLEEQIRLNTVNYTDVISFPDTMLRDWLYVLCWWWTADERHLAGLTPRMRAAALMSPARKVVYETAPAPDFLAFVKGLHSEKHAAYGDSWKRRGEQIGILANIARKIDRLGVSGAGDTAADTVIDLLVYLVKYRLWLTEFAGAWTPAGIPSPLPTSGLTDDPQFVDLVLDEIQTYLPVMPVEDRIIQLKVMFEDLEATVNGSGITKSRIVHDMLKHALPAARQLWLTEQQ